jgi:hypothetical protein
VQYSGIVLIICFITAVKSDIIVAVGIFHGCVFCYFTQMYRCYTEYTHGKKELFLKECV